MSKSTKRGPSALSVRQAVLGDLELLSTLFDNYRQFQGQASDLAAARSFMRDRFDHGESIVFICHDGDDPAGFAQMYPSFSSISLARVFVLNDLFVQDSWRRKGVAARLLAAVESYAWSLDAVRVSLAVPVDNASARQLYEALGWKKDKQYLMYHRFPS